RLSHAQGNGSQGLPRLLEADRRQAGGTGMVRRQVLRARSLWLRLLHLGNPPRAADGGAQALHRVQGAHAQASRRQTRGGGREDQGLIGASVLLGCVSCLTFGPADALYGGDVTERSVMAVGVLPPPLLGVSSLDWAPLAAAGGAFFHVRVVSDRDSSCPGLTPHVGFTRLAAPKCRTPASPSSVGIHRKKALRSRRWIAGS